MAEFLVTYLDGGDEDDVVVRGFEYGDEAAEHVRRQYNGVRIVRVERL